MSSAKVEKTQAERITECMTILKKLSAEVGIDAQNPSIRVLKKRMAQYWRDGKVQEDKLPLWGYDRSIIYKLPRWAHQSVEVTLRVNAIRNPQLPPDLEEELRGSTNQQPTPQLLSQPQATNQQPTPHLLSQPQVDSTQATNQQLPSDPAAAPLP